MRRWLRITLILAIIAGAIIGGIIAPLHAKSGGPSLGDYESGLIAALASASLFIFIYSIREPWWRDWIGRFIVSHVLVFAIICIPFVLSIFFTLSRLDSEVAAWILLASFYLSSAILLLGTVLWLHISMTLARERREKARKGAGTAEEPEQAPTEEPD